MRGRQPNRDRDSSAGLRAILRDYFGADGAPPLYGEEAFERRFRVTRPIFLRIYNDIRDLPFWRQRVNATGRPQAHPLQKLVAAFRVLAYGESYDRTDKYVRLSRSTVAEATSRLVAFLVARYAGQYLRPPSPAELQHILARNAARGFPGCMGSIDCSHWQWAACPKALAGQYQDRKGRRTVVIETVCDEDLYIWHFFIELPGSHNDLGVLSSSPLFMDVAAGRWPPRDMPFSVNGRQRRLLYYLADSMYPQFALFATPYPSPDSPKKQTYNRLQVAVRKDAERLYAVMRSRFHIALHPARFRTVDKLIEAGTAVAVLHNMLVEARRAGFISRQRMAAAADAAAPGGGVGQADDTQLGPPDMAATPPGGPAQGPGQAQGAGQDVGAVGSGCLPNGDLLLPPLPMEEPNVSAGATPPDNGHFEALVASAEATDGAGHYTLREDLAEHIYAHRRELLEPYL